MKLSYIKIFTDFRRDLQPLSDEEVGRLLRAMLEYAETEVEPELTGNERFVWGTAAKGIDKERESYTKLCERNQANIKKRYESLPSSTKSTTGSFGIPSNTTVYQTYQEEEEKKKKKRNKDIREKSALEKAIDEFKVHRQKLRAPMTDRAVELMLKKLEELADTDEAKIAIINQSIERGYKGIFPVKDDGQKAGRDGMGSRAHYKQTMIEIPDDFFVDLDHDLKDD